MVLFGQATIGLNWFQWSPNIWWYDAIGEVYMWIHGALIPILGAEVDPQTGNWEQTVKRQHLLASPSSNCLLYTSDAADE